MGLPCFTLRLRVALVPWYHCLTVVGFILFLRKRLEAGYVPAKRPTRHSGDVPAPISHAVKVNPHGEKLITLSCTGKPQATKQLICGAFLCSALRHPSFSFLLCLVLSSPTGSFSSSMFPSFIVFRRFPRGAPTPARPPAFSDLYQVPLFPRLSLVSAWRLWMPPAPPASGQTPIPHPMCIRADAPAILGLLLIPA